MIVGCRGFYLLGLILLVRTCIASASSQDLTQWQSQPAEWRGATVAKNTATLTADGWSYLTEPTERPRVAITVQIAILEPTKKFRFFGEGWSAWPDKTFGDDGFEAALLLQSRPHSKQLDLGKLTESAGYRVQLSYKYQVIALVKFPEGGYVQVAPCKVELNRPYTLAASANNGEVVVSFDGEEKFRWHDEILPLNSGHTGVGASSLAKVQFKDVSLTTPDANGVFTPAAHAPRFSVRQFLGGRSWIFDENEPILELHTVKDSSCFAKLQPGYKPQLTFDSHWGLENQGAFPEALCKWTEPVVSGGGGTIKATWSARHLKDRFTTASTMTVGYDGRRGTYTYEIESELEVLPGEPFHFRYGFDFEHHTPLDPFRWQYLIARRRDGDLYHRPVYPVDPGPQLDLDMTSGQRVWYGRHAEQMRIAPAVEYLSSPGDLADRRCNTAVCAAFYDTGVAFTPETSPPGTKLRVRYRYTGYPADEAAKLFASSHVYDSPTLDPQHYYIFADAWPKLTFDDFVPMSSTWIYGRTPFMTAHNVRPTYELEKNCGAGSGYAMRLGPNSYGKASLPVGASLSKGRWIVTALVKSANAHGPGGRIELELTEGKAKQVVATAQHFVGNGTFDWQRQGFAFDVPEGADGLKIAFGNAGTGAMLITDVEFRRLPDGEELPADIASKANDQPPQIEHAPAGAIADYRMQEGAGNVVFNYAEGKTKHRLGHLELANLDWTVDSGRTALRFADNTTGRKDYRRDSGLARSYLSQPAYVSRDTLPIALSGTHGGGAVMPGLTLSAWIKPAAEMGHGQHRDRGDILGFGARRFVLDLEGVKSPYSLAARVNVNDVIKSTAKLEADRWYHVAMTAEPTQGQWHVQLFLDGQPVAESVTTKAPSDAVIPSSLILGAEIFYFHHAYYRGLVGRTLVFDRALSPAEVAKHAK